MKTNYITMKYKKIELLYDYLADKVWIDKKNLALLLKTSTIHISRLISNLFLKNLIDSRYNSKIFQKTNYKTHFIYDNKVIRILLNDEVEFKNLLLFQKEFIKDYKNKMLGKIYFKNGNVILNDSILTSDLLFNKKDIEIFFNTNINIEKEKYDLFDVFNIGYLINNVEFKHWSNNILKKILIDGFYINNEKCFNEKEKIIAITNIADNLITSDYNEESNIKYKSITKFNRTIYDSKTFFNEKINNAKNEIIILSRYIDDSIFMMLEKPTVKIKIYTETLDVLSDITRKKYIRKHKLKIISNYTFNDTFIIIDNIIYHIDVPIINIFKDNNTWSIINMNINDLFQRII